MKYAYHTRIYTHYVQSRTQALAPDTLGGLAPRAPYLRRLVRMHFPADRHAAVLDLGCGHGALLHFAHEAGYTDLRGVDGSPEQVAAALRLSIEGVAEGDLRDTLAGEADAWLDVLIAFDVIEHFPRDELLPFVDQVQRVLKPGGRWILHAPDGEPPFFGAIRFGGLTRELAFTRTSLIQLILYSGFADVHCFEDAPVVHGAKSAVR
jgi:2-polyprenyl-3-methyl-5-hydroxy-6-metoxy-1,4-benzoquinol methylase